jgi:hypothetical protein
MLREHSARRWLYNEPSRRKKLGARAREHRGRKIAVARKEEEGDGSERKKTKGMGTTPTRATLFIGGPPNLSVVAPCSVQHAPTVLSREVREKIEADFSLTNEVLQPKSEFRS